MAAYRVVVVAAVVGPRALPPTQEECRLLDWVSEHCLRWRWHWRRGRRRGRYFFVEKTFGVCDSCLSRWWLLCFVSICDPFNLSRCFLFFVSRSDLTSIKTRRKEKNKSSPTGRKKKKKSQAKLHPSRCGSYKTNHRNHQ